MAKIGLLLMIFKFYIWMRQYVTETIINRRDPGKEYQLNVKNQGFEGNLDGSNIWVVQDLFIW